MTGDVPVFAICAVIFSKKLWLSWVESWTSSSLNPALVKRDFISSGVARWLIDGSRAQGTG